MKTNSHKQQTCQRVGVRWMRSLAFVTLFDERDIPKVPTVKLVMLRDYKFWDFGVYLPKGSFCATQGAGWYVNGEKTRIRFWVNLFSPGLHPDDPLGKSNKIQSKRQLAAVRREVSLAFLGHNRELIGSPVQKSSIADRMGKKNAKSREPSGNRKTQEKKHSHQQKQHLES
jgi:hypothetical protein